MGVYEYMLKDDMEKCHCELRSLIRQLSQIPFEIENWIIIGPTIKSYAQLRISTRCGYIYLSARPNGTYDIQLDNYLEGHPGAILNRKELALNELINTLSKNVKYVL